MQGIPRELKPSRLTIGRNLSWAFKGYFQRKGINRSFLFRQQRKGFNFALVNRVNPAEMHRLAAVFNFRAMDGRTLTYFPTFVIGMGMKPRFNRLSDGDLLNLIEYS